MPFVSRSFQIRSISIQEVLNLSTSESFVVSFGGTEESTDYEVTIAPNNEPVLSTDSTLQFFSGSETIDDAVSVVDSDGDVTTVNSIKILTKDGASVPNQTPSWFSYTTDAIRYDGLGNSFLDIDLTVDVSNSDFASYVAEVEMTDNKDTVSETFEFSVESS